MSDIINTYLVISMVISTVLTVFSGTSVFVFGQVFLAFLLNPIKKQKEIIGEICDTLIFYANVITNSWKDSPKQKIDDAKSKLRELSALLITRTNCIPLYEILSIMGFVIPKKYVRKAHYELIGLSNNLYTAEPEKNEEKRQKVFRYLRL